jgi:pimeloyl-ACP methyl ester carboxylesterase
MGGQAALDLTLAHPNRVSGLVLIGTAVRGSPYPDLKEGPTAELDTMIESAENAGDIDEVNRLEAWMWLDGPTADEGRVVGAARDLFLEMNGKALRAGSTGEQTEIQPAWPRLAEIATATLIMIARLDAEDIRAVDELAAGIIPDAQLAWLDGVAHLPHLEGDPVTLDVIADFVDSLAGGG